MGAHGVTMDRSLPVRERENEPVQVRQLSACCETIAQAQAYLHRVYLLFESRSDGSASWLAAGEI